jgi:uncharacterized repeat protein (TIGR03803 family)
VELLERRWLLSARPELLPATARSSLVPVVGHLPAVAVAAHRLSRPKAHDVVLHNFGSIPNDGYQPWGSLMLVQAGVPTPIIFGKTAFGGTHNDGALFTISPSGTGYTIVHSFLGAPTDGAQPHHGFLTQLGNKLYGATVLGGNSNKGVIYSIKTDGTGYKLIHNFAGGATDGATPHSDPTAIGPILYGMTAEGGSNSGKGDGVVYQMNPDGSGFSLLHAFSGPDGADPHGYLISNGTYLYGMTRKGGTSPGGQPSDDGVIFRIGLNGQGFTVLHDFRGGKNDGATPDHGGLTLVGNTLFGLTTAGGSAHHKGHGVLFEINTDGTQFTILHRFKGGTTDGAGPHGSLFLDGSELYGMTSSGGPANDGSVFRIDTSGNQKHYRTLYFFNGPRSDGRNGLDDVFIAQGTIFGMTKFGGSVRMSRPMKGNPHYDQGVIFSLPK